MNDSFLLILLLLCGCGCGCGCNNNGFAEPRTGFFGGCGNNSTLLILLLLCVFQTCNCGNVAQPFNPCV